MDTGAVDVSIPANMIGFYDEQYFVNNHKTISKEKSGLINNIKAKYYSYRIPVLKLGSIKFHYYPLWITFDNNVNMALLGMSFVGMFNFEVDTETNTIVFTESDDLHNALSRSPVIKNPMEINRDSYLDLRINDQLLQSNNINRRIKNLVEPQH